VGLSIPPGIQPAPVVRVDQSYENTFELRTLKMIARTNNHIAYQSNKEILFLISLTDRRVLSNQEVLKIIKQLRAGSGGLVGTAALLGLMILIFSMSEGFVPHPVDPGWRLNRPNPFQPPSGPHKFPPYYEFFSPRRTPGSTLEINRPTAMPHQ
jgi:hypothetical protein